MMLMITALFTLVTIATAYRDCSFNSTLNVTSQRLEVTCGCDIRGGASRRKKLQKVEITRLQGSGPVPLEMTHSSKPVWGSLTMIRKKTYAFTISSIRHSGNITLEFHCEVFAIDRRDNPADTHLQEKINLLDHFTNIFTTTTTTTTPAPLRTTTTGVPSRSQPPTTVPTTTTPELVATTTTPAPAPTTWLTTVRGPGEQHSAGAQEEQGGDLLDKELAEGFSVKMLIIIVSFSLLFIIVVIIACHITNRTRGNEKRKNPPPPPPCGRANNGVPWEVVSQLVTAVASSSGFSNHRQVTLSPALAAGYYSPSGRSSPCSSESLYAECETPTHSLLGLDDTATGTAPAPLAHSSRHNTGRKCSINNASMLSANDMHPAIERDAATKEQSLRFQHGPLFQNGPVEQPLMAVDKYRNRGLPCVPAENTPLCLEDPPDDPDPQYLLPIGHHTQSHLTSQFRGHLTHWSSLPVGFPPQAIAAEPTAWHCPLHHAKSTEHAGPPMAEPHWTAAGGGKVGVCGLRGGGEGADEEDPFYEIPVSHVPPAVRQGEQLTDPT